MSNPQENSPVSSCEEQGYSTPTDEHPTYESDSAEIRELNKDQVPLTVGEPTLPTIIEPKDDDGGSRKSGCSSKDRGRKSEKGSGGSSKQKSGASNSSLSSGARARLEEQRRRREVENLQRDQELQRQIEEENERRCLRQIESDKRIAEMQRKRERLRAEAALKEAEAECEALDESDRLRFDEELGLDVQNMVDDFLERSIPPPEAPQDVIVSSNVDVNLATSSQQYIVQPTIPYVVTMTTQPTMTTYVAPSVIPQSTNTFNPNAPSFNPPASYPNATNSFNNGSRQTRFQTVPNGSQRIIPGDSIFQRAPPPVNNVNVGPPLPVPSFYNPGPSMSFGGERQPYVPQPSSHDNDFQTFTSYAPNPVSYEYMNQQQAPIFQQPSPPIPAYVQYLQALVSKPDEKDTFDGDPRAFLSYITHHEVTVASMDQWSLKMDTLFKSLSKKVAQRIEPCRLLPPQAGYERAKDILFKLYGNPAQVRESVVGDLKKGGHIAKNDKEALFSLSLDVSNAHEILKALTTRSQGKHHYERAVNTDEIIGGILARVPYWIDAYGHEYKSYEDRCCFSNLRTFLELKTEDALDPLITAALKRSKEIANRRARGN